MTSTAGEVSVRSEVRVKGSQANTPRGGQVRLRDGVVKWAGELMVSLQAEIVVSL